MRGHITGISQTPKNDDPAFSDRRTQSRGVGGLCVLRELRQIYVYNYQTDAIF